jgi:hypothetical protein
MFSPRRRIIVAVVAVVAVVGLGLGVFAAFQITGDAPDDRDHTRVVQPGAPGQPGRTMSNDELATLSPPAHTTADTLFMQRMIPHHAQALEMTALVKGRAKNANLPLLAAHRLVRGPRLSCRAASVACTAASVACTAASVVHGRSAIGPQARRGGAVTRSAPPRGHARAEATAAF